MGSTLVMMATVVVLLLLPLPLLFRRVSGFANTRRMTVLTPPHRTNDVAAAADTDAAAVDTDAAAAAAAAVGSGCRR